MKSLPKKIPLFNDYKVFFLYPNKYWTIEVSIDTKLTNQELDTYLSYKVAQTTSKEVLFFYIKQQNSYLVFISRRLYIEKIIKRHPRASIMPFSIFYKSLLEDISWAVFYIGENNAFVITNINNNLNHKPLPISISHIDPDTQDIIKTISLFINNMMPHIDNLGAIKNIYFDSSIDIVQKLDGENVYKDINIQKIDIHKFNPKKLALNFSKIKSFRFYILTSFLIFMAGSFFSAKIYLQAENKTLIQNIKSQNKQSKTINHSMQTIKDIKNQIINIEKTNGKQIIPNSNFANKISKTLSSQNKIIKTISMDANNSYVK